MTAMTFFFLYQIPILIKVSGVSSIDKTFNELVESFKALDT